MVYRRDACRRLLSRLLADDGGQDLIEYALLTTFVGLAGVLGYQLLGNSMKSAFESWNSSVQSYWEPSDPAAGS